MNLTQDHAARPHRLTASPGRGGRTGSRARRDHVKAPAAIQAEPGQADRASPDEAAVARLVYRTCRIESVTHPYIYAFVCMLSIATAIVNCALSSAQGARRIGSQDSGMCWCPLQAHISIITTRAAHHDDAFRARSSPNGRKRVGTAVREYIRSTAWASDLQLWSKSD
jgi:hypothetical protein